MTRDEVLGEIKEIAEHLPSGKIFINIYLNLDHKDLDQTVKDRAFIRKYFQNISNALPKHGDIRENFREFQEDFWETFENLPQEDRGVYLMGYDSNIKTFELKIPLERRLIVSTRPYISYIEEVVLGHPEANILLIDSKNAKFFYYSLGEARFMREITSEVPRRMKRGGWSQMKFERHIEDHILWHFKKVAEGMAKIYEYENQNDWLIFGQHDLTQQFLELLPEAIREKVAETGELDIRSNVNLIEEKLNEFLAKKIEHEELTDTKNLITIAKKHKEAVLGLSSVIDALNKREINKLVLSDDFKAQGYFCPSCQMYQLSSRCVCGNGATKEVNLEESLIEEVLRDEGSIEFTDSQEFKKEGGVGAFLRFRV